MAVQEPRPPPGHSAVCRALGATSLGTQVLQAIVLQAVPQGPAGEAGLGIIKVDPRALFTG